MPFIIVTSDTRCLGTHLVPRLYDRIGGIEVFYNISKIRKEILLQLPVDAISCPWIISRPLKAIEKDCELF